PWLEKPVAILGKLGAIEAGITLLFLAVISQFIGPDDRFSYLLSGIFGLITFIVVDGVSSWLEKAGGPTKNAHAASAGLFLYLEVLDASFSFDGVVGAFAITHNL